MVTNKKILLLGFVCVVIILMIGLASAGMGWDNSKSKQDKTWKGENIKGNKLLEKYKPIKIKNMFGLGATLFEGYISEHDEYCGVNCSSNMEIKITTESVLIDSITFQTLQEDGGWIEQPVRSYELLYWDGEWINFNVGDVFQAGEYEIRIEAQKKPSRTVDWIIETQGVVLNEWAVWNEEQVTYDDFGDASLNTTIWTANTLGPPATGYASVSEGFGELQAIVDTGGYTPANFYAEAVLNDDGIPNGIDSVRNIVITVSNGYQSGGCTDKPATFTFPHIIKFGSNEIINTQGSFSRTLSFYKNYTGSDLWDYYSNGVYQSTLTLDSPDNIFTLRQETNCNSDCVGGCAIGTKAYVVYYNYTDGLVHLNSPEDTEISFDNEVEFNCSAEVLGGAYLTNLSLWTDEDGSWELRNTSETTQFIGTEYSSNANYPTFELVRTITVDDDTIDSVTAWLKSSESQQVYEKMTFNYTDGTNASVTKTKISDFLNYGLFTFNNPNPTKDVNKILVYLSGGGIPDAVPYTKNITVRQDTSTKTWDRYLTDSSFSWNCQACDTDGDCGFSSFNFTGGIDTIPPTINLTSPTVKEDFGKDGEVIAVVYNITDENIDSCWYDYNGTNTTIPCGYNATTITVSTLNDNEITIWANDTLANTNSLYRNWTYFLWQEGETFNSVVGEISDQTFTTNVSFPDGDAIQSAKFWYGGDSYSPDISLDGDSALLSYDITTPNIETETNYTFFWEITLNPTVNTTAQNQTVLAVSMDNCSAYSDLVLNFTLVDEATEVIITGANSSIETDVYLYTIGGTQVLHYHNTYSDTPYASVCIDGLLNESSYSMDVVTSYVADNYVEEFWFLDDGVLTSDSWDLNDYVTKNVTLRDLPLDDSTSFLMSYQDEFRAFLPESIVTVLRKYIGQGEFKEAERCQQDNNGQCHLHLVEEDVIYQFRITYLGELQYLSGEYNAKCLETVCKITIIKSVEGDDWDDTLNNLPEGTYSVSTDKDARTVTLEFNLNETGTMQLDVFEYDNTAESDTLVGTSSVVAKTGSTQVIVPLIYGNKTYYSVVRHNSGFVSSQWVDLNESGYQYFGGLGLFLGALLVLTLGLIAISSGGWTIGFLIFGMFIASITKIVDMDFYLLMWIISAGALIIWKLSSRRSV